MLVKTYGSAVFGVDAIKITVETDMHKGFKFFLVGLPDSAVKESEYRINSALKNLGYKWPGYRITINMAPADIRKEGSAYDLTIAMGILGASGQINTEGLDEYIIMGELSLDGSTQPIKGALHIAIQAQKDGFKGIILPIQNAEEAAVVEGLDVYGVRNVTEVIDILSGTSDLQPVKVDTRAEFLDQIDNYPFDFSDVKGQENIKRTLEIAASGGHNVLLVGPPGSGKTMLAKRMPSILPPLSLSEALETTKIHSVAGKMKNKTGILSSRPFRSPHHTISDVALVGGGSYPQPGEISLAHNGVLFLDELPEFQRSVLEVMRQPLEDREVTISRARFTVTYPSSLMLIASMNPSPSGFFNEPGNAFTSSPQEMQRYLSKISGPLLDRIDLHVEVHPVPFEQLSKDHPAEGSASIRKRVIEARAIQSQRFKNIEGVHYNAQMGTKLIRKFCKIDDAGRTLLKNAMDKLGLSARAYDRILKVSRTIADLEKNEEIRPENIAEAIQYRSLDREGWLG